MLLMVNTKSDYEKFTENPKDHVQFDELLAEGNVTLTNLLQV